MTQFLYTPIGIIHTPFQEPLGMPIQPSGAAGVQGTVEIYDDFVAGLKDLDGFSHIVLLYHFHRHTGYSLEVKPYLDDVTHGLFSTRAPKRPNPIGLSVVQLDAIKDHVLYITNVDIVDGTPLLDIKPYVPDFDSPGVTRTGWLEKKSNQATAKKSDTRI